MHLPQHLDAVLTEISIGAKIVTDFVYKELDLAQVPAELYAIEILVTSLPTDDVEIDLLHLQAHQEVIQRPAEEVVGNPLLLTRPGTREEAELLEHAHR